MDKEKEKFELIKEYIEYDKLIENFIIEREKKIKKYKIEMIDLQFRISIAEDEIRRIKEEQSNSSYTSYHMFIDPKKIYRDMTSEK